ncbi:Protein WALLS ARE THIN 1, partial [Striga hermonthica]
NNRPRLTWSFALQFFLLAIVGITTNQGFYLLGLDHTSPNFCIGCPKLHPGLNIPHG